MNALAERGGSTAPPPAVLALLHPTGRPHRVRVLGSGLAGVDEQDPAGAGDLLVLAPRGRECDDDALRAMAATAVEAAGAGALVLVVAPRRARRTLRRHLDDAGVGAREPAFLTSRRGAVVAAERAALERLAWASTALGRVALRVAGARPALAARLGSRTVVVHGPGTVAGWLGPDGSRRPSAVALVPASRGEGGTVLVSGAVEGEGVLVAKVRLGDSGELAEREARALEAFGAGARATGVDVPVVIRVVNVGAGRAPVLRHIAGTPAARESRTALETAERLAGWLARWTAATRATDEGRAILERELVEPLEALAGELPPAWNADERRRVAASTAGPVPVAAVHGDLTLWNVLRAPDGLAVVDWEEARLALPLLDLPYLIVDAVVSRERGADRIAAYQACFRDGGNHAAWARSLVVRTAADVPAPWLELVFDACWLGHAADERRRGLVDGPFLGVLRSHARGRG